MQYQRMKKAKCPDAVGCPDILLPLGFNVAQRTLVLQACAAR
jgi:hypothetical protein